MISFAETVVNVKPNKSEENVIPYTYEETVMCIYEYGECYRNLNRELSLFSEADGTDNPGKIQRLMAWLRKMWDKFKAWLKRVFGFSSVSSNVDNEVADNIMENTVSKHSEPSATYKSPYIIKYSEAVKPIIDKISQRIKNNPSGKNSLNNGIVYDGIIQCANLLKDTIRESGLTQLRKGAVMDIMSDTSVGAVIASLFFSALTGLAPNKHASNDITFKYPSLFKKGCTSDDIRAMFTGITDAIQSNASSSDLNNKFAKLFGKFTKLDEYNGVFGFVIEMSGATSDGYTVATTNMAYVDIYGGIVDAAFGNTNIHDITRLISSCEMSNSYADIFNALKIEDKMTTESQINTYAKYINTMSHMFEVENAIMTNGLLMSLIAWFDVISKPLDEAIAKMGVAEPSTEQPTE